MSGVGNPPVEVRNHIDRGRGGLSGWSKRALKATMVEVPAAVPEQEAGGALSGL